MSTKRYDNVLRSRKSIVANNFLGGIAWGIGATIGLSIVLAVLTFLLQQINFIPGVGDAVIYFSSYFVPAR